MKKKAFTLAETLITMTIIGIVAALTIPTLMNNYMRKVCSTQLRKVSAQITTAAKTVIADEKADEENDEHNVDIAEDAMNAQQGFYFTTAGNADGIATFLNDYFKHKTNEYNDCVADFYKNSAGNRIGRIPAGYSCIQTPENATICMNYEDEHQRVFIDVNGKQKPNIAGFDLFVVQITDTGSLEDINPNHLNDCGTGNDVTTAASGCYAKVLRNGWRIVD